MDKKLVLDAGGVIITEPIPQLLEGLAEAGGVDKRSLEEWFQQQMYGRVWSGQMTEQQFWRAMLDRAGLPPQLEEVWRNRWLEWLQPTPAWDKVAGWAEQGRVGILSNHLPIWLEPLLKGLPLDPQDIIISARLGSYKPRPTIFHLAARHFGTGESVLFVDDRPGNLKVAQQHCGWQTVLAEGDWSDKVDEWLSAQPKEQPAE